MNDILLLPEHLQQRSLSKSEIVLTYDDALQALNVLESAGWAVLGWEPWLKLPDGSHMHPVMGGDFHRVVMEDWTAYVHRAAQLCRQVLKECQQHCDQDDPTELYWREKTPSMVLYFCLTAGNNA